MNLEFHLAQVNIARVRAPLDDPLLAGFVARLNEINTVADAAPGFVWRLQTEAGDATALRPYDDERILFNLSVWETGASVSVRLPQHPHRSHARAQVVVRAIRGHVPRAVVDTRRAHSERRRSQRSVRASEGAW